MSSGYKDKGLGRCGTKQGRYMHMWWYCPIIQNFWLLVYKEVSQKFGLQCHQYVGVIQFSLDIPSDPKEGVEVLNPYLEEIIG